MRSQFPILEGCYYRTAFVGVVTSGGLTWLSSAPLLCVPGLHSLVLGGDIANSPPKGARNRYLTWPFADLCFTQPVDQRLPVHGLGTWRKVHVAGI